MEEHRWIYITTASQEEALKIGKTLVEERLAACANVLGAIQSVYWWEGKLCQESEAALVVKTRAALLEPLIRRVKALHSYSCPCVVALPIQGGNPDFLSWISQETKRD